MNRQELEIAVLPDGRIEYIIKGVKGSSCEDISALLERLGRVEEEKRTDEYYQEGSEVGIAVGRNDS